MINAAESLKQFSPPIYIDRAGVEHTGRIFSAVENEAIKEPVERFLAGTGNLADVTKVLTEMFDAAVAEEIIHLPYELYVEALKDFFGPRRAAPAAPEPPPAAS